MHEVETKHPKAEKLNFNGFSGYYGDMSGHDGYGGFDYSGLVNYMNQSMWTNANAYGYQNGWCDSGYQNVAAAAKATSLCWIQQFGTLESANGHSFTLQSFLDTASWSQNATWEVTSYTDNKGVLTQKGTMEITPTFSKAETVTFKGKDWTGIAAVSFQMLSTGSYGNTCTYGHAVGGNQMCIDKLKVSFAKKADLQHDKGNLLTPYQMHHHQNGVAHVAAVTHISQANASHMANASHEAQQTDTGYHSQLLSLGHESGLVDQFHLPAVEHFA